MDWLPQLRYQCDFETGLNGSKPNHTMIGTNVFLPLDSKGPCGMTMTIDIDDDSATKHGDFHTSRQVTTSLIHSLSYSLSLSLSVSLFLFIRSDHAHKKKPLQATSGPSQLRAKV